MTERIWMLCVILLAAAAVVALVICLYRAHRRKKAGQMVRETDDETKCREINRLIEPYGFGYSLEQDMFYSLRNPWQRQMGYRRLFDEMAPSMNMIIDCEPIYFRYAGKAWMIELWKGQYGITTGAEIGIYQTEPEPGKRPEELHYDAAGDEDSLLLEWELWRKGRLLLRRRDIHWWLTGFRLGDFSESEELTLRAFLTFPDSEMRNAFLQGAMQAGYGKPELSASCNMVALEYSVPKTAQPKRYSRLYRWLVQRSNRRNCRRYLRLTRRFDRTVDRLTYLFYAFPHLYRVITRITWGREKQKRQDRRGRDKWGKDSKKY